MTKVGSKSFLLDAFNDYILEPRMRFDHLFWPTKYRKRLDTVFKHKEKENLEIANKENELTNILNLT